MILIFSWKIVVILIYFLFFCGKTCFCFQKMNMFFNFLLEKKNWKGKNTEKKGLEPYRELIMFLMV
jgi:hypothetical protein